MAEGDVVLEKHEPVVVGSEHIEAGWPANLKALFDTHLVDIEREREAANAWSAINLQAAQNALTLNNRINNDAHSMSMLILSGEVDTTAQGAMANSLANQMRSVAFEAVQSALAQAAQTSAPAQGTTGVAQGAIQTGAASVNTALIANLAEVIGSIGTQLAKINEALDVILVKVTSQGTVEPVTPVVPVTG